MSRKMSNASLLEVTGPQSLQLQNFRYFRYTVFQRLWIKSSRCHLHRWSSLALIKICSYLPFRKGVGLYLHSIYLRMLCAKFVCKWHSGSGKKDFFNFVNVFSLFQYNFSFLLLPPLGEKRGLSFEETWIPSIQEGSAKFGRNWASGSGEKDF